ncbi:MAG: hypothetical protein M1817_000801 [Caeruleum heppii]|nr:MAG: hypothetical protein M1817_000801 [Caeruleum heppii]
MPSEPELVLFHYSFSPYVRRVVWYLTLRGIEYSQCIQPPVMPREDLGALGVSYRRIPVLAIGSDIILDSRLMLQKLEERHPEGRLGSSNGEHQALEKLLETWTIDGGIFNRAAQLIPTSTPILKDDKFKKDREEYSGRSWAAEDIERARPEAMIEVRAAFEFVETTLLADGRDWLLKTQKPSLADLNAIWPLHWMTDLKGAIDPSFISKNQFPRVFAWIERFIKIISEAKQSVPKPKTLKGSEAVRQISSADFGEPDIGFDTSDPSGLREGQDVEVWPIDTGFNRHDHGRLVGLSKDEVVIETQTKIGEKTVRIHAPRHGFRIAETSGGVGSKL